MNLKRFTELSLEPLPDGQTWRLAQPFSFLPANGRIITAPLGFVTDLASIPRVAWIGGALILPGVLGNYLSAWANIVSALGLLFVFLSPCLRHDGKYTAAAVLHDWLYDTRTFSRARTDGLFLEMMTTLGVNWWQRWLIYLNVRAFGWIAWRSKNRNSTR